MANFIIWSLIRGTVMAAGWFIGGWVGEHVSLPGDERFRRAVYWLDDHSRVFHWLMRV